jgi:phosphonoacetate hydrolase
MQLRSGLATSLQMTQEGMNLVSTQPIEVNGRQYHPPQRPVVVICIDGCADEYLSTSIAYGRMPTVAKIARQGYRGLVRGALPSFTNVNNAAIVSGMPPSVTGICGNFFLNPETGEEVMMNSPEFLRCETILTAAARAGRKVAFITAKEKLRTVLGDGLVDLGGIAFSSEKVDEAKLATHGIDDAIAVVGRGRPEIYSGDASVYVLQAGTALLAAGRADFLYLSLTDFMQHKYAPDEEPSLAFYEQIDTEIGKMIELGAVVAATADHGMNAKNRPDGTPHVIYVQTELAAKFDVPCRVICPITDPYVVHHGALGSLVMVHVERREMIGAMRSFLLQKPGITEVYTREEACAKLELAPDRIGDLVVLSGRDVVLGRTPEDHDLSVLNGGLRSHGGRYEEMVPLLVSEPLGPLHRALSQADPRNFDVFDFACNGAQ